MSSSILDHPVTSYTRERLSRRLTERTIQEQLFPMLMADTAPTADQLIGQAWGVVRPLLTLSRQETAFVEAIQRGEFRAGLLGDEEADELVDHPAVAWKLRNVRKHLGLARGSE